MNIQTHVSNYDHPLDVIEFLLECFSSEQDCALVAVTGTMGGSVRSVGAIVGVRADGLIAGYVSNGCIDANLAYQSLEAIRTNQVTKLCYGAGSKFRDIKLPCGGTIDLLVVPSPDHNILLEARDRLKQRQDIDLIVGLDGRFEIADTILRSSDWHADYYRIYICPKLQLRIAGVGAELMALARLGSAAGFDIIVQSPNKVFLKQAELLGAVQTNYLETPSVSIVVCDDQWTAFVLLFHDHDWELELLQSAIASNAFYIGALGSRKAHAIRCDRLREAGAGEEDIKRIHGPIGLVQSLRNASMVATSCLAEIILEYTQS
jgi:xanthine dehydrogenase accessory factor